MGPELASDDKDSDVMIVDLDGKAHMLGSSGKIETETDIDQAREFQDARKQDYYLGIASATGETLHDLRAVTDGHGDPKYPRPDQHILRKAE